MAMSFVQIDVNAHIVGEFSADSSGVLVIGVLEAADYDVTNSEGKTESVALCGDGGIVNFDFTSASSTPIPTSTPTLGSGKKAAARRAHLQSKCTEQTVNNLEIETGNIFTGAIEIEENPALVSQITSYMSANNGTQYWNSGTGIWNYPINSIWVVYGEMRNRKRDFTNRRKYA